MNLTLTSLQQILRKSFVGFTAGIAALLVFSIVVSINPEAFAKPDNAPLVEDIADTGDSQHPSGKDRNTENGKSGTQGKSESNPDGDGADKRRDAKDGAQGGTQGQGDYDDNNGCGNDHDFADDNNGNCGGKHKASPSPKPSYSPKPTPSVVPSPSPKPSHSPKPSPSPEPSVSPKPSPYKIKVCHATGSSSNPYVLIEVSYNGVKHGHEDHKDDIIPAPYKGCPKPESSPSPKPSYSPKPSPSPSPSVSPSPSPTPSPTPTPTPTPTPSSSASPKPSPSPSPSTGSVLGVKELPATGTNALVYALMLGVIPVGIRLARYKRSI